MIGKLANPDNWELVYAECRNEHVWTYIGPETQPWKVIEELRRPPENDAWKSLVEYAYKMGGDGARNIEATTGHYNAAIERATKAEAGLSLAVRALEVACPPYGIEVERNHGPDVCVWRGDAGEKHDEGCAWLKARLALSDPAIVAEAERLKALEVVLEAARKIHHWHCWGRNEEGMVVSSDSVRGLWAAIERHDAAIAQVGTEGKP